jgi:four helix bundle protein
MTNDNVVQTKSYAFAVKVVKVCWQIQEEKKEFVLSKQLLRSSTSVGANIEEAIGGQSKRDFFAKLSIAYKEARETHYWIRLMVDTHLLSKVEGKELLTETEELLRIIGSIQRTIRHSLKDGK